MMTAGLQTELEELTQRLSPGASVRTAQRYAGW
jgi:hypothetical protein